MGLFTAMNDKLLLAIALGLLAFSAVPSISFAKNSDFEQSVNVTANNFGGSLDEKTLIYRGNVTVAQGTLLIKADKLVIDSSAGKGKEVFIASGEPAVYSQTLEGDKPIQANANEIRYDFATRVLTLIGKAEINQSGSLVQSAKIQYDLEKQTLKAESGSEEERVSTIFTPEKK
jgi:lipopolysaccharide export system protein LptA